MLKKAYVFASFALVFIAIVFLVFYYAISQKNNQVAKYIKKNTVFDRTDLINITNPFKYNKETATSSVSENSNIKAPADFDLTELVQIYDLPAINIDFDVLGKNIVWTEKETGQTYGKDLPKDKHSIILKNPVSDIYSSEFTKDYTIKTLFDDSFKALLTVENISGETFKFDKNIKKCKGSKYSNTVVCSVTDGSTTGIVKISLDNSDQSLLYTTNISKWNLGFTKDNTIITQYPSDQKEGVAMILEPKARVLLTGYALQTKTSPDSKYILYSTKKSGKILLSIYNTETSESNILPLSTIANKCVVLDKENKVICAVPDNMSNFSIDAYNLGTISTSDTFYEIDLADLSTKKILFDNQVPDQMDVVNIKVNNTNTLLGFINKTDRKPWVITLPIHKNNNQ